MPKGFPYQRKVCRRERPGQLAGSLWAARFAKEHKVEFRAFVFKNKNESEEKSGRQRQAPAYAGFFHEIRSLRGLHPEQAAKGNFGNP